MSASTSVRGERLEVAGASQRLAVDPSGGVRSQPVHPLGPLQDPVHERQVLVDRPGGQLVLGNEARTEVVDMAVRQDFGGTSPNAGTRTLSTTVR